MLMKLIIAEKISQSHYQVVTGNHKYFVPVANFNELQKSTAFDGDPNEFNNVLSEASDFVLVGNNVAKKACSAESLILHYVGASGKIEHEENLQNPSSIDSKLESDDWVNHDGRYVPIIDYLNQEINWRYRGGGCCRRPATRDAAAGDWRRQSVLDDWRGWIHAKELNEDYHIIAYQIKDV